MSDSPEAIEQSVNTWLDDNWDPNLSLKEWRTRLVEGGWSTTQWPSEFFGRGFTTEQAAVVTRVFNARGIVPVAQSGPRRLAAETILSMGNRDQKSRYLRPILTGEHSWCQLRKLTTRV